MPTVSSVFSANPDIPEVELSSISPPQEPLYANENVTFSSLGLSARLSSHLVDRLGYKKVTYIQQESLPTLLSGCDTLVKSQTGSGKTLAFAAPMVDVIGQRIPKVGRSDGPVALLLVPTRELCQQTLDIVTNVAKSYIWIVSGALMGGQNRHHEKSKLKKGVNIVVATPGRLLDHLRMSSNLDLSNVQWLIIDEADRLLDLGFEKDVLEIVSHVHSVHNNDGDHIRTILLSATISESITKLAWLSLDNPVYVNCSSSDNCSLVLPSGLQQHYTFVPQKQKLVLLASFIRWKVLQDRLKVMVFFSCCDSVKFYYDLFRQAMDRVSFYRLHGGMNHSERVETFAEFKSSTGGGAVLCTDVGARGLDVPHVAWVIQFDTPGLPSEYLHRVGRTARIGMTGNALLLLIPGEEKYLTLLNDSRIAIEPLDKNEIFRCGTRDTVPGDSAEAIKSVSKTQSENSASDFQLTCERLVHDTDGDLLRLSRSAFMSHLRAYASNTGSLRDIFCFKALHLGHVAKSFALRDTPSKVKLYSNRERTDYKKRAWISDRQLNPPAKRRLKTSGKTRNFSEFDSGL